MNFMRASIQDSRLSAGAGLPTMPCIQSVGIGRSFNKQETLCTSSSRQPLFAPPPVRPR
jgi:hypothetical protein